MSDVNAAAESIVKEQFYVEARIGSHNYRNNAIGKPCRLIYGNGGNVPVDEILKPLADAYLALHPADDGEAIDEAWLRSNYSFTHDGDEWLVTIRHAPDAYTEFCRNRSGVWQLGSGNARHMSFIELHKQPKTRGDFRRLLAAIG